MATVITTTFTDDLDGAALERDDVRLIEWSWDGVRYVLETSADNKREIENGTTSLARVLAHSRRSDVAARSGAVPRHPRAPDSQSMAIRLWARQNGHTVNKRGRISAVVLTAFAATH